MINHTEKIRKLRWSAPIYQYILALPGAEQARALAAVPDLLVMREVKQLLALANERRCEDLARAKAAQDREAARVDLERMVRQAVDKCLSEGQP